MHHLSPFMPSLSVITSSLQTEVDGRLMDDGGLALALALALAASLESESQPSASANDRLRLQLRLRPFQSIRSKARHTIHPVISVLCWAHGWMPRRPFIRWPFCQSLPSFL